MLYMSLYSGKIFFVLMLVMAWALCLRFYVRDVSEQIAFYIDMLLMFVLSLMISYDIRVRPIDILGDTFAYYDFYLDLEGGVVGPFDKGFVYLSKALVFLDMAYTVLFLLVPLCLMSSYYCLSVIVFGRRSFIPLLLIICLALYPFFFSLAANILRQGVAIAVLNFSLSMLLMHGRIKAWLLFFLAFLLHKSSVVFAPIIFFYKRLSRCSVITLLWLWFFVSLASYFGLFRNISQIAFSHLSALGLSINYSDIDASEYLSGFRWDFWFFSSFPVVCLSLYTLVSNKEDPLKSGFMNVSCLLGIFHIMLLDIAYSDRFGVYAWIYYPILMAILLRAAALNVLSGYKHFLAMKRSL